MRSPKVLILDDDLSSAKLIECLLKTHFTNLEVFNNPQVALSRAIQENFQILIVDYEMPEMNGQEFITALRSQGVMSPFIFYTGHSEKEIYKIAIRLGAADLLEKGFESAQLLEAVIRTLELEERKYQFYTDKVLRRATLDELEMQKIFMGRLVTSQIKVS